ncbi:MAG: hypothetical protein Q9208_004730 [Pyrenodesmia sp. 3 TL-2023]
MAGAKRASDGQPSAAKRPRLSSTQQPSGIPENQLQAMEKDELVSFILKLQKQLATAIQAPPSPPATPATPALSKEDLDRKVSKARAMMEKGIKSQMKWKPSCKGGSARFSYSGVVATASVFLTLFCLSADWKKKQILFSPLDFQDTIDTDISTSIRYGYLNITGEKVTVRWNAEDLTFTVTGFYGL